MVISFIWVNIIEENIQRYLLARLIYNAKFHIKRTFAQKEAHYPALLGLIFNYFICVDTKDILIRKTR